MPRFVILLHEMPADAERPTHWDFMLEQDGVLRTWALEQPPAPGVVGFAQQLPDHRIAYLDYEGPVSQNRGQVARWDAGSYTIERESDRELVVHLAGNRLRGRIALTRAASDAHFWSVAFSAEPTSG